MKAIVQATFTIDVSAWRTDEGLSKKQRMDKIQEDLYDFSVFMPHFEYKNFSDVSVAFIEK